MKKFIYILIVIIIVFGLVLGAYSFFSAKKPIETLKAIFPFGKSEEQVGPPQDTPDDMFASSNGDSGFVDFEVETFASGQLTDLPSLGTFTKEGNVRYIEKQTGHIYNIDIDSGRRERITNTTIPGIQRVYWNAEGTKAIIQYEDENNIKRSFLGEAIPSINREEGTFEGTFLANDLFDITVSPSKTRLFTLSPFKASALGTSLDFTGKEKEEVFRTPFTEWTTKWIENQTITFTSKPSVDIEGSVYFLNTKTERFQKIFSDILGLTTNTSPNGKYILYSESRDGGFRSYIHDVGEKRRLVFGVNTLAEKCVWGSRNPEVLYCGVSKIIPNGEYPDTWYQGDMFFSDDIWKINLENGATDILFSTLEKTDQNIDIINIQLNEEETRLLFNDKKDGTLWFVDI